MGEMALYRGQRVKIGTCESMYYLRAQDRHLVARLDGNVDVADPRTLRTLRFRFPWPDEDATAAPGEDNDRHEFARSLSVHVDDWTAPDAEHGLIQFSARNANGYLLTSLPCPMGKGPHPAKIHRNGWGGDVAITQQGYRDHGDGLRLVTIAKCPACGSLYQLTRAMAETVATALRKLAALRRHPWPRDPAPQSDREYADFLDAVADRMMIGYEAETP